MENDQTATIRRATEMVAQLTHERGWSPSDIDWSAARPEALSKDDHAIVRYITYVEDHIPAFLSFNLAAFPTTGDISVATYHRNREYARFLFAWANDEEKHASTLSRYQVALGIADEQSLAEDLAEVGRKPFSITYQDPVEAFLYLLLQEKATQLFYRNYSQVVEEPVLRQLLQLMSRDEAKHFAFYFRLIEESLARDGAHTLDRARDVLANFRMPLDGAYSGYWRTALKVVDRVGHDHTESYSALETLVRRSANSLSTSDVDDFSRFLRTVQKIP